MNDIRNKIVQALDAKFRSDLMDAVAKIEVYLENPVGIGEHSKIVEEAYEQVNKAINAQEGVRYCQNLYDKAMPTTDIPEGLDDKIELLVSKMDNFLSALGGTSVNDISEPTATNKNDGE